MTMDNFQLEYHDRATPEAAIAAVMGAMIVGAECGLTPDQTITLLPDACNGRPQWGARSMLRVGESMLPEDGGEFWTERDSDRVFFRQVLEIAARVGVGVIGHPELGNDPLGMEPIFGLDDGDHPIPDHIAVHCVLDILALVHRSKFIIYDVVAEVAPDTDCVSVPLDRLVVGDFPRQSFLRHRLMAAGFLAHAKKGIKPEMWRFPDATGKTAEVAEVLRLLDLVSVTFGPSRDALFKLRKRGREVIAEMLDREDLLAAELAALTPDDEPEKIYIEVLAGLLIEPDEPAPMRRFWGGLRLIMTLLYSGEAETRIRKLLSQAETIEALHGITRCHDLPAGFQQWDAYRFPKIFFPETPR